MFNMLESGNTSVKEVCHMIAFIRNSELMSIKKKLFLLYILNVIDIIFTLSLLRTGLFAEANFFMVKVVESPILSFLLKVVLPAIFLYYFYIKSKDAEKEQLRVTNFAINISLTIYTLVNISHLFWTAYIPIYLNY